jgi:dTDP-4-amino-4,6-dideoxygalactose transaminase
LIPFLDLKSTYLELKSEIDAAVMQLLNSGWYILGPEVEQFEAEFAAFCGASHCVGVGNGLDALILALRALDIGPGQEVIVPANTYIATWLAVSAVGATPVPVEPEPETHCLDPHRVEQAITPRTAALLPVHLYGHPADVQALSLLCQKYGLRMVEDAAQAHGAQFGEQRIGSTGDIVAWSFYPGKNLGAFGDGGAITTNDRALAERVSTLRNYGSTIKYINTEKGVNSRLDPIQAAVLRAKLPKLREWNARREQIAQLYSSRFSGLPIGLPTVKAGATHAWHLYVITTSVREALQAHLTKQGVGTLIHYPVPPFRQKAFEEFAYRAEEWPIADSLAGQVLSLPMGPHLAIEDASRVADAVELFFGG